MQEEGRKYVEKEIHNQVSKPKARLLIFVREVIFKEIKLIILKKVCLFQK